MKKVVQLSTKDGMEYIGKLMKLHGMNPEDLFEVTVTSRYIMIKPCRLKCSMCGSKDENKLISRNGVLVCEDCIDELEAFKTRTGGEDDV